MVVLIFVVVLIASNSSGNNSSNSSNSSSRTNISGVFIVLVWLPSIASRFEFLVNVVFTETRKIETRKIVIIILDITTT